jgi:hypothetical protein
VLPEVAEQAVRGGAVAAQAAMKCLVPCTEEKPARCPVDVSSVICKPDFTRSQGGLTRERFHAVFIRVATPEII